MEEKQNEKRTAKKQMGQIHLLRERNKNGHKTVQKHKCKSSLLDQKQFRKIPNNTEDTITRQIREKLSLPAGMSLVP